MFNITTPASRLLTAGLIQNILIDNIAPQDSQALVYDSAANQWTFGSSVQGATGFTGPTGYTGPTGASGTATLPVSQSLFVSTVGNDTTGTGTFTNPYRTVFKAIDVALLTVASFNPIAIKIAAGVYVEDNSVSAKDITSTGISLEGDSSRGTIIKPLDATKNIFTLTNRNINIENVRFEVSNSTGVPQVSTAYLLSATGTFSINVSNCVINYFSTGIYMQGNGSLTTGFLIQQCVFTGNTLACSVEGAQCVITNSTITGSLTSNPSTQNGIYTTGSSSVTYILNCILAKCNQAVQTSNNSYCYLGSINLLNNINHVVGDTGSSTLCDAGFISKMSTTPSQHIGIVARNAGTTVKISSLVLNGKNYSEIIEGWGCYVEDGAQIFLSSSYLSFCSIAVVCGNSDNSDTSTTILNISGSTLDENTQDIEQYGSSTCNISLTKMDTNKIFITNPVNVFFSVISGQLLAIGNLQDEQKEIIGILNGGSSTVALEYFPSLEFKQSCAANQANGTDSAIGNVSDLGSFVIAITNSLNNPAGLVLSSNDGDVTNTDSVRQWIIQKRSDSAELDFEYRNNILNIQPEIPTYTLFSLDGYNKYATFDEDTTIFLGADTTLSRTSVGVLNVANEIETGDITLSNLTANRAIVTNASSKLETSVATSTEVGYLSGVTSAIQTQLNNRLPLSGGTLTGTLTLSTGTVSSPSLLFSGGTSGFSSSSLNRLDFITAGTSRMNISSSGTLTIAQAPIISAFTSGVLQSDGSGNITSSSVSGTEIADTTIDNDKLATVSSANNPNYIVSRDGSGNFSTNMITIDGTPSAATDVATVNYVNQVVGAGLVPVSPCLAVADADVIVLSGAQLVDDVFVVSGDRVLLTAQVDDTENGIWVVQVGAWTRPTDFDTGNAAEQTYTLILDGTVYAGSGWICNTPTAIIDLDPIIFVQFTAAVNVSGSNLVGGTGLVYSSTTGNILEFRSLEEGIYTTITNNVNTIEIDVDATSLNTPSTIIARNGSGNFAAGTITANLVGNVTGSASLNVLKAGDTMTGSLTLPASSIVSPSLLFDNGINTGISNPFFNFLSLSIGGSEALGIDNTGVITIPNLSTIGVVHNSSTGVLSTSLIVNADIDPAAAIVDTKLATISTAGKVANSATTATSSNVGFAIVTRSGVGNFAAGTITANLVGNVTGAASLNVLKSGDTMTGDLVLQAGNSNFPSLQFVNFNAGLFSDSGSISFSTTQIERMRLDSAGDLSLYNFTTFGVVHNSDTGLFTTSLIVNDDIDPAAGIVDTKLSTISTSGKVSNSATTATSLNSASAIVSRDGSGNFAAGTITANITGASSLNVLKAGDTMTGSLTLPAGSSGSPSLLFTGGTDTGISMPSTNVLSISTFGVEAIGIDITGEITIPNLSTTGVVHNSNLGVLSTSLIVNADVDPAAGIVDTKLATISTAGKVSNSATTATSSNTASAIVSRDGSGNFAAGTITASSLTATNTTNQITLGTTNTITINSVAPSASRTYRINPISGNGDFAMVSTTGSSNIPVSYESAITVAGASPTLTASDLVGGIIRFNGGAGTITMPTGASIAANASLAPFNVAGAVFKVLFTVANAGAKTLANATDCTVSGGNTITGQTSRLVYFVASGGGVWTVY